VHGPIREMVHALSFFPRSRQCRPTYCMVIAALVAGVCGLGLLNTSKPKGELGSVRKLAARTSHDRANEKHASRRNGTATNFPADLPADLPDEVQVKVDCSRPSELEMQYDLVLKVMVCECPFTILDHLVCITTLASTMFLLLAARVSGNFKKNTGILTAWGANCNSNLPWGLVFTSSVALCRFGCWTWVDVAFFMVPCWTMLGCIGFTCADLGRRYDETHEDEGQREETLGLCCRDVCSSTPPRRPGQIAPTDENIQPIQLNT